MDATKTFIKVSGITPEVAEDFSSDYDITGSDLLTELVPNLDQWGDIGWMELEDYDYDIHQQTMHFTLETKWKPPLRWLQQVSCDTPYFENKLITMVSIQKDETFACGAALMDGETLQDKTIWSMESDIVAKYYDDDESDYDLDDLDNQIWDSVGQFLSVCEKFYLSKTEGGDETSSG